MFVKGFMREARPRVFGHFDNSFSLPMFSVNLVLKNLGFFCLISFWVLYFTLTQKL